ncbi:hypothetical protein [Catenuloplanes japonicus]|uniref:hypothetical protein n=1 Tax=Catenuloplanes japonicus TaxID=33876 RepID=UPI000526AEE1|nr:hypothetical protein [Catenuloplanes japonicus]
MDVATWITTRTAAIVALIFLNGVWLRLTAAQLLRLAMSRRAQWERGRRHRGRNAGAPSRLDRITWWAASAMAFVFAAWAISYPLVLSTVSLLRRWETAAFAGALLAFVLPASGLAILVRELPLEADRITTILRDRGRIPTRRRAAWLALAKLRHDLSQYGIALGATIALVDLTMSSRAGLPPSAETLPAFGATAGSGAFLLLASAVLLWTVSYRDAEADLLSRYLAFRRADSPRSALIDRPRALDGRRSDLAGIGRAVRRVAFQTSRDHVGPARDLVAAGGEELYRRITAAGLSGRAAILTELDLAVPLLLTDDGRQLARVAPAGAHRPAGLSRDRVLNLVVAGATVLATMIAIYQVAQPLWKLL